MQYLKLNTEEESEISNHQTQTCGGKIVSIPLYIECQRIGLEKYECNGNFYRQKNIILKEISITKNRGRYQLKFTIHNERFDVKNFRDKVENYINGESKLEHCIKYTYCY